DCSGDHSHETSWRRRLRMAPNGNSLTRTLPTSVAQIKDSETQQWTTAPDWLSLSFSASSVVPLAPSAVKVFLTYRQERRKKAFHRRVRGDPLRVRGGVQTEPLPSITILPLFRTRKNIMFTLPLKVIGYPFLR